MKKKSRKYYKPKKPKAAKKKSAASRPQAPRITLKEKLQNIYTTVNLETTCSGRCECCKTAMPQMNYSEFLQLANEIWDGESKETKIALICRSIEYFFRYEFKKFGKETLVKPCMLLSDEGKCSYYERRPLSCRLYGLWPEEAYNARVDKFEKAYEGMLTRDELPLNTQCQFVKRVDDSEELTEEVIEGLYDSLDSLDARMGHFTPVQIKNKENYRTFHDWLLWSVLGEENLTMMTKFMLMADRETIEDQVEQICKVYREKFAEEDVPDLRK